MAVVIQRVVGGAHGRRFYPDFSGVARSRNFYPSPGIRPEDGVVSVALGLGRTVAEGGRCLSFCPSDPRHILQFSSVDDILANSQREFWALELGETPGRAGPRAPRAGAVDGEVELARESTRLAPEPSMRETAYGLDAAEQDGTLFALGSTYSPENQAIFDGLSRPGVRLVSFAPILKHGIFPLADILRTLLELGEPGHEPAGRDRVRRVPEPRSRPATRVRVSADAPARAVPDGGVAGRARGTETDRLLVASPRVLGNGVIRDVRDLVAVDFHRFDRSRSVDAAAEVARLNAMLLAEDRPYLLVGVGRWGSTDPWLGIPVTWDQIAGARAIVEAGFRDMRVTPSQGSHFFQNLTSFQVGYFTVNADMGEGFVDWEWLGAQPAEAGSAIVRHLRFERPLEIRMDGREGKGVIYKPGRSRE